MTTEFIARTGRVQSWIDDPNSRLPVSCTVFVVQDSMEGPNGIEASWRFVSHALRYGAGVAVHLSNLRGAGTDNGKGLVASGPVSFGKIYSCLNEQLRRGGVYKNGAVVLHLDINHADILEFVQTPRNELPWAKRCVNLTTELWNAAADSVKSSILEGIARGDIWLAKIRSDQYGQRIYANVCLEVFLRSRGTCLLEHINMGACTVEELPGAFVAGMEELIDLHAKTGVESTGEYLTQEEDRQVGLGMLGLANLLAIEGVTYAEFGEALNAHLYPMADYIVTPAATKIVKALAQGIASSAAIARMANMDRAFAIAPTASCSYRYKDRAGYTTAPELAPPIGRNVDRDSSTFGVESFDYGNVETSESVGWDDYKKVVDGVMEMLMRTGLCHGYSFNSWSDVVTYDEDFIQRWLRSPQTSLYYSLQVMQNTQAKDDALAALDGNFGDMFGFDDETDEEIADLFNGPATCVGCAE
jgi:hypothetical protein|tara:strand:+ start:5491 stop:6906 length:1416 start_codon:yes stop_codon:yes gene_type:complete